MEKVVIKSRGIIYFMIDSIPFIVISVNLEPKALKNLLSSVLLKVCLL